VNEIDNTLAIPVEDPMTNNILRSALEVCNKGGYQKKKLKLHLIACLCSTFRKRSVDSIGSWPTVDVMSVLQRMCTTQCQWAWTLLSD
jgi:hypothetical protein